MSDAPAPLKAVPVLRVDYVLRLRDLTIIVVLAFVATFVGQAIFDSPTKTVVVRCTGVGQNTECHTDPIVVKK